jgi:HD-GYP domain-containing protein (c-di-GMP phosphodiesterase class II)
MITMGSKTSLSALREQMLALNKIGISLSRERDINSLLSLILTESRQFANAEGGTLYIREDEHLRFAVTQNVVLEKRFREKAKNGNAESQPPFSSFLMPLNKNSLSGYVAVTGKVLNIPDAYKIPKSSAFQYNRAFDIKNEYRTKSIIGVPVKDSTDYVVGVLQLINARKGKRVVPFTKGFESLLLSLASQAAISIRNARLTQELKEAYLDTIFRLSVAAEYKDDDTAAHINRMSRYSALIAESMGLSAEEVEKIRYASPMHDIGKLGVPDAILMKPAKLTNEEFKVMQEHTVFGSKILSNAKAELLRISERIALTHHEKWDGSGYPQGLSGENIPLEGRIVALADVFDALTTKRCYKPAFSMEQSLDIIKQGVGKHFDPRVTQAFLGNLDKILAVKAQFGN